jgi:hypothetical protein
VINLPEIREHGFILATLTGRIITVTVTVTATATATATVAAAALLLLIFEAWLVVELWRQTRAFAGRAESAERDVAALRSGVRGDAYAKHPN